MTERPLIVCLTPIKNEAWILDRFLQCASLWADHIIIADQGSTDGSQEIAKKYPKVMLVENKEKQFQGTGMRRLLLHEARKISGKKLLIALDADEILPLSLFDSAEWQDVLQSAEGARMQMRIANLWPDFSGFYSDDAWYYLGFMDDSHSDIEGGVLHESRLPDNNDSPIIKIQNNRFLHYAYLNKRRNESKQRWYMCYERVINHRNSYSILKQYYPHHHPQLLYWKQQYYGFDQSVLSEYESSSIDMRSIPTQPYYWWDTEVINYLLKEGSKKFGDLDIWYVNWHELASLAGQNDFAEFRIRRRWIDMLAAASFKAWFVKPRNIFNILAFKLFVKLGY